MGKDNLDNYFKFTRTERIGTIILVVLSLLSWLAFPIYQHFAPKQPKTDFAQFKNQITALEITLKENEEKTSNNKYESNYDNNYSKYPKKNYNKAPKKSEKSVIVPFEFDPNTISQADLLVMGIPRNAIDNLIKFRNKGAKFYKKADFKKVYGITDDIFSKVEQFIKLPVRSKKKFDTEKYPELKKEEPIITPFPFDPNDISESDIVKMGFPEKVAKTIGNYRNKGGTFRKKEDLSKIYGIRPEDYQKIEPFITIKKQEKFDRKLAFANMETPKEKAPPQPVDINHSSAEDWSRLYGIGPSYAKRIILYREKLGGFYTIDQVKETYGLPDSTYQKIKPFLELKEENKKMDINVITLEGLKTHPYLNTRQAKAIINYRSNHGDFADAEAVAKVRALTPEDVERIVPYLKVE